MWRLVLCAMTMSAMCGVAHAQPTPIVHDAERLLRARGATDAPRVVSPYRSMGPAEVGLVEDTANLYLVSRVRGGQGFWTGLVRVGRAGEGRRGVEVLGRARPVYAIVVANERRGTRGPCDCIRRGGQRIRRIVVVDESGSPRVLLSVDADLAHVAWDDAAQRLTVRERSGLPRCPRGCPPMPFAEVFRRRVYRLSRSGGELVGVSDESRVVHGGGPAPTGW